MLNEREGIGSGSGKLILLGEHSVVYGRPAIAAGLPEGIEARLREGGGWIRCPEWSLDLRLADESHLSRAIIAVLGAVGLEGRDWRIELRAGLPHSAGLGSSAALCVAVARAAGDLLGRSMTAEQAAEAAYAGELCFHGTPSGIDNTVAAFGGLLWFRRPAERRSLHLGAPLPLVVAHSGGAGETAAQVAGVRRRVSEAPDLYEPILDRMGALVEEAEPLLAQGDWKTLGPLLDQAHECLERIGVSTPELDRVVELARSAGAWGAKLTGAGGGGCALALCPEHPDTIAAELTRRGYPAFVRTIHAPREGLRPSTPPGP